MILDLEALAVRRAEEQVRALRSLAEPIVVLPHTDRPCPCGCGREIAPRTSVKGPAPRYATSACGFRFRRRARKERAA